MNRLLELVEAAERMGHDPDAHEYAHDAQRRLADLGFTYDEAGRRSARLLGEAWERLEETAVLLHAGRHEHQPGDPNFATCQLGPCPENENLINRIDAHVGEGGEE